MEVLKGRDTDRRKIKVRNISIDNDTDAMLKTLSQGNISRYVTRLIHIEWGKWLAQTTPKGDENE